MLSSSVSKTSRRLNLSLRNKNHFPKNTALYSSFIRKNINTNSVLLTKNFHSFLSNETPKGFDRYFRKPGGTASNSESSSKAPEEPIKSTTNNSTHKADSNPKDKKQSSGPKKKPEEDSYIVNGLIITAFVALLLMGIDEMGHGQQISWRDFQVLFLENGLVDRIIVSNKNIARIVLRTNPTDKEGFQSSQSFSFDKQPPKQPIDNGFAEPPNALDDSNGNKQSNFSRYPSLGSLNKQPSPYYFNIGTVESFERKLEEAQRELGIPPRDFIPVMYVSETSWSHEFMRLLPTIATIGLILFIMRGASSSAMGGGPGGIFKIGKSNAKKINKEKITTTFADVAGCDEAKREIMEFVQFLKDSKKFTDLGAKIPKGALLCGPPGTGKTLLAKATAGEANVPFFSISGSDFVEMFVGVGPSRVRDMFKEARENAPCIIFIDEIDAVGRQRGRGGPGGNDERENTLNQLLVEMDGFDSATNVIVLAGTNRVDVLDAALTRPGRFDRQIQVDKPDIKGRKAIFEVYLKGITLDGEVDLYAARLAALTPGFVGADIANICNEAAIVAARRDKNKVDMTDFETATDRIIGGLESKKIMTVEEKRVVAYHEAGHAVAGWNLEYADPLLKVTIVPRGSGALGFAQYLPKELFLRNKEQILDMVCMALAGRAAEQVTFGRVTTGAADDLRRVTQIVYQMVQVYGMNERVGQVAFPREESQWPQDRLYSNATAEVMDQEVRSIVDQAYQRTLELMAEKQEQVRLVAELLLEKETITNMDVTELIGVRPFAANKEYAEYVAVGWNKTVTPAAAVPKEEGSEGASTGVEGLINPAL